MATTINLDEHLLIGGSWIDATGGARFDVTDPATGNKVGSMPNGTEADVQAAIDAGRIGEVEHGIARVAKPHALMLVGQEARPPEPVVEGLVVLAA